jgi:MFS family permease
MAFKGNLWHHWDFIKFWTGDTITQFTGQISGLALPTIAVLTLQVTGFELGILNALGFIAFPTLGLFVGVWMDRTKRKPVMIVANLIQVAALASVPGAFIFGALGLYQLYIVSFIMGTTTLFFDVAYQSYLPSLVNREDVVEGNQKLQTSASAAQVVGPSVASVMMQLLGAALSVIADAFGTLAAVFTLVFIRKPEPKPEYSYTGGQRQFFTEMKEGIKVVTGNKLLWTQAGCTGTSNLGTNIFFVAVLLYAYRTLGISKGVVGIAFSIGAVGFLVGVLISSTVTSRLGLGKTTALSIACNFGLLITLLASGNLAVLILGLAFFVGFLGGPIYNINMVSLRQIITPNRLQGRMNATMRTIVWGTIPAGSLLGGIFSTSLGIIPTLIIGTLISGGAILWIVLGPIFKLKKQPEPVSD